MNKKNNTKSDILKELESDDEFPDVYNDITILPAYMNNNRFDEITFPWINNFDMSNEQTQQCKDQCVIQYPRGILKKQDLYCLKSVESLTCSGTLIWFVNFLLHKDLQSHYNFLKSCLINDFSSTILFANQKYDQSKVTASITNRFEIVMKL